MSTPTEMAALITATNNLTQTVIDKRTEITSTVNAKIAQLDNWKNNLTPTKIGAEPRYVSTIDLTGLSTERYYPVWWPGRNVRSGILNVDIFRHNLDYDGLNPFDENSTVSAALFLQIEQLSSPNSKPNFFNVVRLSQMLRNTVRNIRHGMRCANVLPVDGQLGNDTTYIPNKISPNQSGLYLRGGLPYTVVSNRYQELQYSREDAEVEIQTLSGNLNGRWMVKSYAIDDPFLGEEYNNFTAPHSPFPYNVM